VEVSLPAPVQAPAVATPRAVSLPPALPLAALLAAAFLVYAPWSAAPLTALDFSEFIPLLRAGHGFFGRILVMAPYYAHHGRASYVTYAWISLNWSLFGDWAMGWDLMRALLMSGVTVLAWVFLRRLGCSVAGATAGAALLVFATPAQSAWTRLTAEPLSLAALLGAALLALGYRQARDWPGRAVAMATLLLIAILAKEVLAVLALPLLILALCWQHGTLRRPRIDRRGIVLAALLTAVVAAVGVLAVVVLRGASSQGYAQAYVSGQRGSLAEKLGLILLPLTLTLQAQARVAALLLGLVAVGGWALLLRASRGRTARLAGLGVALLVPLLGALVYLPWARSEPFYGYPFLVGGAVVLGTAVTALQRRASPLVVALPLLAAFALCAADGAMHADLVLAKRRVNGAFARALGTLPPGDTVFMALPAAAEPAQRWQGPGPTLRRYAIATGLATAAAPPVVDLSCEDAFGRWQRDPRSIAFISYGDYCGPIPARALVSESPVHLVDLLHLRSVTMSYRGDLWLPSLADAPAARR
jgi:hypothetical protein